MLKRLKGENQLFSNINTYEDEALNFYQEEATVWIDPLDGTRGFVTGNVESVTSIIGVSIKGRAKIGIIHKPFYGKIMK